MAHVNAKRVEALRAKKAQIDAQLAQFAARERASERKADTRRKILIGAVVTQEMETRPSVDAWVRKLLGERLTKDRDRALFGLPAIILPNAASTDENPQEVLNPSESSRV